MVINQPFWTVFIMPFLLMFNFSWRESSKILSSGTLFGHMVQKNINQQANQKITFQWTPEGWFQQSPKTERTWISEIEKQTKDDPHFSIISWQVILKSSHTNIIMCNNLMSKLCWPWLYVSLIIRRTARTTIRASTCQMMEIPHITQCHKGIPEQNGHLIEATGWV